MASSWSIDRAATTSTRPNGESGATATCSTVSRSRSTSLSPEGGIAEIALELRDYEPYVLFKRDPSLDVTIDATLIPTDEELGIDPPRCQVIE